MKTMYPAQANSPVTELAVAIDGIQKTITLVDASRVPAPPNLLTIGTDESAETILYTGKSGNDLTGVTRGFQGVVQSWVAGTKVARNLTAYDIDAMRLNIEGVDLTTTLVPGTSVINADQASDLDLTVYGATLTNLLGSDGNFETDSNGDGVADGWTKSNNGTYSLETSNVKYGTRAQRISTVPSDTDIYARRIDHSVSFLAGKKYVFVADSLTDGTALASLRADYQASTITSSADSASSKTHFIKFTPTVDYSGFVRLYNRSALGNTGWVQWDGAGVYEVPEALYNRIGVDITESNIRDYLPHVDGRQHVQGVAVTKQGKNLLPPFTEWTLHANAKVIGPYELELNATGAWNTSKLELSLLKGQPYTLSLTGHFIEVQSVNAQGAVTSLVPYTRQTSRETFTVPNDSAFIRINLTSNAAGKFTFSQPMLSLGNASTAFEPAEPQRLILPVTLASTPDGLTRDRAYYRDGAWRLLKCVDTTANPAAALANPVESIIKGVEGAITLHPGGNQITVETGVIQREKVTFDSGTKRATTSKRSARIIGVYKGTDIEPFTTYTSGSQTLPQLVNAVDSAASYYVTYITLDKYAYTANVTQVDAKYTAGLSGSVSGALRDVARLQTQNDRQDFADDYIEAKVDNLRVDVAAQLAETTQKTNSRGINVKYPPPPLVGAKFDGITDDTATIQNIINSVSEYSTIFFPEGGCLISTLIADKSLSFVGSGRQTLLKVQSGSGIVFTPGKVGCTVKGMTIEAVGTPRTVGTSGISASGTDLSTNGFGYTTITDVRIVGFEHGIHLEYNQLSHISKINCEANTIGVYTKRCINVQYEAVIAQLNTDFGFYIDGDADFINYSCGSLLQGCTLVNNGASGGSNLHIVYNEYFSIMNCMIDVPSIGSVSNITLLNCTRGNIIGNWIGASQGIGINLLTSHEIKIIGNEIVSCVTMGIVFASSGHNIVEGNTFTNNGDSDIVLVGESPRNLISGNILMSTVSAYSIVDNQFSIITNNSCKKSILAHETSIKANNFENY